MDPAISLFIMRNTIETLSHNDNHLTFTDSDIDAALDRLAPKEEDRPLTCSEVARAMRVLSMIPLF